MERFLFGINKLEDAEQPGIRFRRQPTFNRDPGFFSDFCMNSKGLEPEVCLIRGAGVISGPLAEEVS